MPYVANRLHYLPAGYQPGMKLPLFHHGYQGKHERPQEIPQQRDGEPEPGTAEELETGEGWDAARSADDGSRADERGNAPMPMAAPGTDASAGAASQGGDAGAMPESSPGTAR
jgi:hypothetical protein